MIATAFLHELAAALREPATPTVWVREIATNDARELTRRLSRALGRNASIIVVPDTSVPAGGLWLAIARGLNAPEGGDPKRRVRRAIEERARTGARTILALPHAERMAPEALGGLLAMADASPELRLLLLTEGDASLPSLLPDGTPTLAPPAAPPEPAAAANPPAANPRATAPAPKDAGDEPARALAWPLGIASRTRVMAAAIIGAIAIASGFWWATRAPETPPAVAAASTPREASNPVPAQAADEPAPPLQDRPSIVAAPAPRPSPPVAPAPSAPAPTVAPAEVAATPMPERTPPALPSAGPAAAAPPRDLAPAPAPPAEVAETGPVGRAVHINAVPWARIEIDGVYRGDTPMGNIRLSPGVHEVRATFPDGSWSVREVRVGDNERYLSFTR